MRFEERERDFAAVNCTLRTSSLRWFILRCPIESQVSLFRSLFALDLFDADVTGVTVSFFNIFKKKKSLITLTIALLKMELKYPRTTSNEMRRLTVLLCSALC